MLEIKEDAHVKPLSWHAAGKENEKIWKYEKYENMNWKVFFFFLFSITSRIGFKERSHLH